VLLHELRVPLLLAGVCVRERERKSIEERRRNMKRFRGGLVFKAHRLVYQTCVSGADQAVGGAGPLAALDLLLPLC